MNETSDGDLKRLFAQSAVVGADETFVATVASGVAARRRALRYRRAALVTLLCAVGAGFAALLAPVAPSFTPVSALGDSLLGLPDRIGMAAGRIGDLPGVLYLGIALLAVVLPLAGVAWLSRRA